MLRRKTQGWTRVSASAGVTSTELGAELRPERPELPVTPARLGSLRKKGPRDDDQLGRVVSRHVKRSELSRTPVDHVHGLPPVEPPSPSCRYDGRAQSVPKRSGTTRLLVAPSWHERAGQTAYQLPDQPSVQH